MLHFPPALSTPDVSATTFGIVISFVHWFLIPGASDPATPPTRGKLPEVVHTFYLKICLVSIPASLARMQGLLCLAGGVAHFRIRQFLPSRFVPVVELPCPSP